MPGHDHAAIGYALDAGASIIVPQVDTVEQARQIIAAAKFGVSNSGKRSAPPYRWLPDISMQCCNPKLSFWENQNQQAAVIIQVESFQAINNLDEILTNVGEHIDSVWLGNLDCRVSMGLPGFWGQEPEWVQAMKILRATLTKHNKPYSGLALGDDQWLKDRGEGRSLMFTSSDIDALLRTADELVHVRGIFPRRNYSTPKD